MSADERWEDRARQTHEYYNNCYEGAQWDEYEDDEMTELLAKICSALFGVPTDEKCDGQNLFLAYEEKHRLEAIKIKDKLREIREKEGVKKLRVFFIFVYCRMDGREFSIPVFRIATEERDVPYRCKYVDSSIRIYDSWGAWLKNNRLPEMEYCFPKFGYYTSDEDGNYAYSEERPPILEYGRSPACAFTSQLGRKLDTVSAVTSLAVGGATVVSLFTPLGTVVGPIVLFSGAGSAVYGAGRSIDRLIDKGNHGESLSDLESWTSYFAIGLTPLSFATSAANAALANGARSSGRIFTTSIRAAATVLNCANFGLQSGFLALGFQNLLEKHKKDELTSLDLLQFSMGVLFFTHTLIQPKTAAGIIKQAQREHIQQFQNSMSDVEAQSNYKSFVSQNIGDKGMTDQSKIVRTINRINDPNSFFKSQLVSDSDVLLIGGRKGKTIVAGNAGGFTRVNPNRFQFARPPTSLNAVGGIQWHRPTGDANIRKIIRNFMERNNGTVDESVLDTALELMGGFRSNLKKVGDLCSYVEVVGATIRDLKQIQKDLKMSKDTVAAKLKNDVEEASSIASAHGRQFECSFVAAHLYCLHGEEFVRLLREDTDFYLLESAEILFSEEQTVCELQVLEKGAITVTFYLMKNNAFGILVGSEQQPIIATILETVIFAKKYASCALNRFAEAKIEGDVVEVAKAVATNFGIPQWRPLCYTPSGIQNLENLQSSSAEIVLTALSALGDASFCK